MAWDATPCDVEARTKQGLPSGRPRTCRVSKRLLKIVWSELHEGSWPEGMFACHHCDEPRCSNPHHIFPGTPRDNSQDAFRKRGAWGSIRAGEDHGLAKLTWVAVRDIRDRLESGEKQRDIALVYGVSQTAVSNIATGRRWGGHRSVDR